MGIFYIIIFYLIYSFISLTMIYSNDIANISSCEVEESYPSITDLDEVERIHAYKVDDYIKNTICPKYHHQILKNEIEFYQNKYTEHYYISTSTIHLFLCLMATKILLKFNLIENFLLSFVVSIIVGVICYYIVKFLYKKCWQLSNIRIRDYYEEYSSYSWHNHYCYLLSIKQTVIFRYSLRKIFEFLAVWIYLLFFLIV